MENTQLPTLKYQLPLIKKQKTNHIHQDHPLPLSIQILILLQIRIAKSNLKIDLRKPRSYVFKIGNFPKPPLSIYLASTKTLKQLEINTDI